jgi:hypothetical protein
VTIADQLQPVLEKRFPAALVAAFLLQTAGALFWAGSAAERIADLERTLARNQTAVEHIAVMQEQIFEMRGTLARIETKLDRPLPRRR